MGQEWLGPSYFFISLVLGPLNSLLEESTDPTDPNRYTAKAKFCFCKNNKRMIISLLRRRSRQSPRRRGVTGAVRPRMGLAVETVSPLILYLDAGGPAGWPCVPRVADTLLQARGLCRQGRVSRTALLASSYAPRSFEAFEIYRIISKQ